MRLPPRFPKSGYAITLCVLVTLATAAPLWPSELKITYLANEGVLLDCQGKKVLIDALFRDSLDDYMRHPPEVQEKLETGKPPFDGVGLALATHFHLDHWDAGAISRFLVNNPGAVFASTPQATAMLPHSLQGRVRALWPDKDHDVGLKMSGIQVDAFALEHGKTQNLGYRLLVCSEVVLGILYESFIHPVTILSGLPSAGVGALATLILFGQDLNIYGFVGIIMLVGIVKKNAIMMIDFALQAEGRGKSPAEAIFEGCLLRFRPIMMTTMAALMATLPIAFGAGQGAESRRPLGLAVVGGLVVSQLLTLYITPVTYIYLDSFGRWLRQRSRVASSASKGHVPATDSSRP